MAARTASPGSMVLALVIALFLWGVAHGSTSIERGFDVPVVLRGVPDDLVITDQTADVVNVRLLGSPGALRNVVPQKLQYGLNVANAKPGVAEFEVDPSGLEFPRGARVIARSPARIEITFESRASKSVRVRPQIDGDPAAGFEIKSVTVEPARLRVSGARSALMQVVDAPTDTIDVTGQTGPIERDTHVVLGVNHVWIEDAPSVKVRVEIQAKPPAPPPERRGRRG
ncbi:MAG TPA: CdaR family protein [Myxococcota bacterium]|nr:CdaR family protein [Myxococcota bacterium]